jgi:hypothetical protein
VRFGAAADDRQSAAEAHRDPEILPAAERRSSSRGSLSEDSMMAMFQHMTDMQNQFFEQSQFQMQLMAQMLAHLGRSQQDAVRKDLSRIDEIGRELSALRSQMAGSTGTDVEKQEAGGKSKKKPGRKRRQSPKNAGGQLPLNVPEESGAPQPAAQIPSARLDSGQAAAEGRTAPDGRQAANPSAREDSSDADRDTIEPAGDDSREFENPPDTAEEHARLTRRMARLAQERNSRWRRVLTAFGRKPDVNPK